MNHFIKKGRLLSLAAIAAIIGIGVQPAQSENTVTTTSTEIMACGHLFSIDANADHKSAAERARIVQQNLDNALINAKDRTPGAVRVAFQNNNPIVTLDNRYIVTADNNSAVRAGISQTELAERWAGSIRSCLSDSKMVTKYISSLTGQFPEKLAVNTMNRTDVGVMPWGMNIPVAMKHDLNIDDAMLGTPITVALVTDVPLGPGFSTYLPAGTLALGELVNGQPNNPNNIAGRRCLTPRFYALQTPDGVQIPITGHIMGGVNSWRAATINPLQAAADTRVTARLYTDVNQGVSLNGTGGSKLLISSATPVVEMSNAFPGVIAGAWKGEDEETMVQAGFPKLLFSPHCSIFMPAGERLTLQLGATSTIAVNSAAVPDPAIAAARVDIGM